MINPVIITAMHGKPEITKAFCMAARRIKTQIGVETLSVVSTSDRENISLCREYGVDYITHKNKPLGAKWNHLLSELKYDTFTHAIILGSDDIVSTWTIESRIMGPDVDLSGHQDLWFWGMNKYRDGYQSFGYWKSNINKILGVGRMISWDVLNSNDWKMWDDDLNCGLDRSCLDRARSVAKKTESFLLNDIGGFVVDIKFGHNISSLSPMLKTMEPKVVEDVLYKHLPCDEVEYLLWLSKHA